MWTFVHFVGFACFGWMIWWICHPSIGIINIWDLTVDGAISSNVLGVCTKYGGHRRDFSFPSHGEKNNPVMVTLTAWPNPVTLPPTFRWPHFPSISSARLCHGRIVVGESVATISGYLYTYKIPSDEPHWKSNKLQFQNCCWWFDEYGMIILENVTSQTFILVGNICAVK